MSPKTPRSHLLMLQTEVLSLVGHCSTNIVLSHSVMNGDLTDLQNWNLLDYHFKDPSTSCNLLSPEKKTNKQKKKHKTLSKWSRNTWFKFKEWRGDRKRNAYIVSCWLWNVDVTHPPWPSCSILRKYTPQNKADNTIILYVYATQYGTKVLICLFKIVNVILESEWLWGHLT